MQSSSGGLCSDCYCIRSEHDGKPCSGSRELPAQHPGPPDLGSPKRQHCLLVAPDDVAMPKALDACNFWGALLAKANSYPANDCRRCNPVKESINRVPATGQQLPLGRCIAPAPSSPVLVTQHQSPFCR